MNNIERSVFAESVKAYNAKEYRKAASLFYELWKHNSDSSSAAYFGGNSFYRLGEFPMAEEFFKKAISLKKNFYHAMYAHIFIANIAIKNKNFAKAKQYLKAPISNNFESHIPHMFLGYIANQESDYALAEKYFKQSLEKDPENASIHNNLGFNYLEWNKNLDAAEKHVSFALSKNKSNPLYLHSYGFLFFVKKNFKQALVLFKKAFQILPSRTIEQDLQRAKKFLQR